MNSLMVFKTLKEYTVYKNSSEYAEPNVSMIETSGDVYIDGTLYEGKMPDFVFSPLVLVNESGTVSDTAFYNEITKVTYPSKIKSLSEGAFQLTNIEEITLPANITSIGKMAFYKCHNLKKITILGNVKEIPAQTFLMTNAGNSKLSEVNLPNSVTAIGDSAFEWCKALKSIKLPSVIKTIGKNAFRNCESLEMIDLPASVTTINNAAFGQIYSEAQQKMALKTVICRATTPPTLGTKVFTSVVENIYVPDANVNSYKSATNWSTYADKIKGISEMQ